MYLLAVRRWCEPQKKVGLVTSTMTALRALSSFSDGSLFLWDKRGVLSLSFLLLHLRVNFPVFDDSRFHFLYSIAIAEVALFLSLVPYR